MKTLYLDAPSPKQIQFISDKTTKNLAFGGSRGGGKSHAVRLDVIDNAYSYPGMIQMIVRQSYPELRQNHIVPLTDMLHCYASNKNDRFAVYNDSQKELTFPNGSKVLFRYCEAERDAQRFQGLQCQGLFIDEAGQQTEEIIKKLTACVRGVDAYPHIIRYTLNPGGPGHAFFKRLFIDRRFNEGELPEDYKFIQSSVYDNKALMATNPDYIKQLEALPPRLRDMWLYGRWDIAEGMFFSDFRVDPDIQAAHDAGCDDPPEQLRKEGRWCHVIEPFDISKGDKRGWKLLRSFDFGYHRPSSFGYYAIDYDGVMYRFMEVYLCTKNPNEGLQETPDQQFARIAKLEAEHPWLKGRKIDGVADPAIWDASRGESIARTADKYGLHFLPGDHERLAGWMQCHYRLQPNPETGLSRFYVFSNCKDFIRTIPSLVYDDHKPEDLDTDGEDHIADEWRYACMNMVIPPLRPVEKKAIYYDPLDQFKINKRRKNT